MDTATAAPVGLHIGGVSRPAASGERFADVDPSTGEPLAEVASAGPDDVAEAIEAARAAQPAWAARPPRERGRVLLRAAAGVRADAEQLARTETADTGKPMAQSRADVEVAAEYLEFYGGFADKFYGDAIPLDGVSFAVTFHEPMGVTGHITPWNYPIQIGTRTLAPALMAGNACVVKPAEEAPLSTLSLAAALEAAGLPPGVLNVVPGIGEVAGAALAESDRLDHLSFTGGPDAGRAVMGAAAQNLKPLTMELGGKSPSVVLADADLVRAVPVITKALVQNAGQTCSAGTRVVVHRSRQDELTGRLVEALARVRVGRGSDDPDMGPLISVTQRDRVLGYVATAKDEGAQVAVGGGRADVDGLAGFYVEPTLLVGATPDMRVAREEVFGPVLTMLVVDDEQEALTVADGTDFGLITAVWTGDVDRALWLARHLQCGQVYVNSYGAGGGVSLPFGGFKKSGFGREKGVEAVREYTQTKTVTFDVQPSGRGRSG